MNPFHYWNWPEKFPTSHEEVQTWIQEYPIDTVIHCYKGDGSSQQEAREIALKNWQHCDWEKQEH